MCLFVLSANAEFQKKRAYVAVHLETISLRSVYFRFCNLLQNDVQIKGFDSDIYFVITRSSGSAVCYQEITDISAQLTSFLLPFHIPIL